MNQEEIREKLQKLFPGEFLFLNALIEEDNLHYIYHFVFGSTKTGDIRRLIPHADVAIIQEIQKKEDEKKEFCKELEKLLMENHGTLRMSI